MASLLLVLLFFIFFFLADKIVLSQTITSEILISA